jgi:hypothetical protein
MMKCNMRETREGSITQSELSMARHGAIKQKRADDHRRGAVRGSLCPARNSRLSLNVASSLVELQALIRRTIATGVHGAGSLQVVWPLCCSQSHVRNQPKVDETCALRTVSFGVASTDDDEGDLAIEGGF